MSIREPQKALALFIAAFILCGCVKDTTLDAGLERKVVVEFVLTEDNVQNLYLSLAKEPGEKVAPPVQETEIRLIDVTKSKELNREIVLNEFVRVSDYQWTLDYAGIPGHEYRLEVKVDEYETVWAEQKMPKKMELVHAATGDAQPLPQYMSYGVYYHIDNIPDFLIIRGTKRNKETGEYLPVEELCTDYPGVEELNPTGRLYDGNSKWRTGTGFHFTETGWEDANYVYHDSPIDGEDGVWTYMFPNLIGRPLQKDFLFISRVEDNHAGLDKLHDFPNGEGLFRGKAFCISGSFEMNQSYYDSDYNLLGYDEYLIVSSLSPDYGRFWKEAWQFKKTHEGDDLSSIYLRDSIYSNIQGGLGIFGAMTSSETPFSGYYREN